MKLHLGCGKIYLEGFLNIDFKDAQCFLLQDVQDCAPFNDATLDYFRRHNVTTKDNYYKFPLGQDDFRSRICDAYYDIRNLPFSFGEQVDEILCYHVLEHFTLPEGEKCIEQWCALLCGKGRISIAVPYFEEILNRFCNSSDFESYRILDRLFYGSHNRGASLDGHKSIWSTDFLIKTLQNNGIIISNVRKDLTDFEYNPTILVEGIKRGI